uniref:Uncharacterized protein n=1 Tax=Arundo donax TaxID=35708 RepID=A0A0A9DVU7_ARUDO
MRPVLPAKITNT